jgi:predicted nucleic acid-binding protein
VGFATADRMIPVFVDSSFWIAFRSNNQADHGRTVTLVRRLYAERAVFVTSYLAFAEMHAHFARIPLLREQVIRDFREAPETRVENPEPGDYGAAFALLAQYSDKTFSFCDAVSFVIMRRLQIRRALSLDEHFRQIAEFEVL